jgi:hypothetical protein
MRKKTLGSAALVILMLASRALALTPEQAQIVISNLARKVRISKQLSDETRKKIRKTKNGDLVVDKNLTAFVILNDYNAAYRLAMCRVIEKFGTPAQAKEFAEICEETRTDVRDADGIVPDDKGLTERDRILQEADKAEADELQLY